MKRHLNLVRSTDAAEIAEAALVLPLVFMFLLGIVWFGRAFNIYSTIQQAAQQGAITAAREACATCSGSGSFPTDATVVAAVTTVMQASSLDPSQIPVNSNPPTLQFCPNPPNVQNYSTCSTTVDNVTVCRQVILNQVSGTTPTTQTPLCGTAVVFQYPFQFYLPFTSLNMQKITLTAQAQSRMEN